MGPTIIIYGTGGGDYTLLWAYNPKNAENAKTNQFGVLITYRLSDLKRTK